MTLASRSPEVVTPEVVKATTLARMQRHQLAELLRHPGHQQQRLRSLPRREHLRLQRQEEQLHRLLVVHRQ